MSICVVVFAFESSLVSIFFCCVTFDLIAPLMRSGKCEVALFGEYVDILTKLMLSVENGLPVFLIQFAKVKIFRGMPLPLFLILLSLALVYVV